MAATSSSSSLTWIRCIGPDFGRDINLIYSEQVHFSCHKVFLVRACKYFESMFTGDSDVKEVELPVTPQFHPDAFQLFLDICYEANLEKSRLNMLHNMEALLYFANYYQAESLLDQLLTHLSSSTPTFSAYCLRIGQFISAPHSIYNKRALGRIKQLTNEGVVLDMLGTPCSQKIAYADINQRSLMRIPKVHQSAGEVAKDFSQVYIDTADSNENLTILSLLLPYIQDHAKPKHFMDQFYNSVTRFPCDEYSDLTILEFLSRLTLSDAKLLIYKFLSKKPFTVKPHLDFTKPFPYGFKLKKEEEEKKIDDGIQHVVDIVQSNESEDDETSSSSSSSSSESDPDDYSDIDPDKEGLDELVQSGFLIPAEKEEEELKKETDEIKLRQQLRKGRVVPLPFPTKRIRPATAKANREKKEEEEEEDELQPGQRRASKRIRKSTTTTD